MNGNAALCFYWRSKTWNSEGIKPTHVVIFDMEAKSYKTYSTAVIPQGRNAMELNTKSDLDKLVDALEHLAFKKV